MKILLFLVILVSFCNCQHPKSDVRQLTTTSVIRDVSTSLKDTLVPSKKETVPVPEESTSFTPKPESSPKEVQKTASSTVNYHVIVASHPRAELAEETLNNLKNKGYSDARMITKDNRFRVSIAHYASKEEALQQINTWKKHLNRDDLWVLRY